MRIRGYKVSVTAQIGIVIVVINLLVALLAPLIAPYDQATPVGDAWTDPSAQHWLGLDNLGRDILSRLIYGARMSIGLSLVITALSFLIGVVSGFAAAVAGGWIDLLLSRLVDLLLSMPTLIFAFVILSVLGSALPVLIVTIAILNSTKVFRLARSVAMNIVSLEFVEAARLRGEGWWWIVTREVLPNAVPPLTAEFGLRFCFTFLFIAALSFLGLGVQPPNADWGSMVKDYSEMINFGSAAPLYPAGGNRYFDHRRQFCRRLDALDSFQRPGRRRMSQQSQDASRANDNSVILDVRGMRVAVRTDAGDGPVLVDDVSLQLRRGEVIGLIGESGAGKSTIGLASMGYTRRDCHIVGGNIIFGDTDIRAISLDERRALRGPKIAYIAQSAAASFNPAHTLMEQVCEASVRHGVLSRAEARAEAVSLFKQLDLPSPETIGSRYPHQVSGGQLQRVMAAMAMVAKPDILIFDEPTTALDVTTQVECLAAFRKLIREHGTAALYITHDLAVVAQIADRIMVLKRGKMVEFGDLRQILQQPKEEYTRRLVTERVAGHNFVDANLAAQVPILAIDHVSANYPGKPKVIDDVSLEVRKGDTVAVVGESGSGKSTLARVVTGLLPRVAGDVRFNGTSLPARLKDRTKDQLRRVQMIYQMPDVALNPQHTLLETIGRPVAFYFNRSREEVRARAAELLRQMDLPESFITRKTSELSGGQKQRVSIARALAAEPDLIICDEVTSALDQLVGEEILRLLKKLQDDLGVAYLFITHDLGTVKRIANKVAVMLKGKVVAGGDTAAVFAPPYHPYTELLLSSVPEMRPDWLDEVLAARATGAATTSALLRAP